MAIHLAQGPSYEDQVVPALRRRLENESAYLTHRLSSKNVHDPSSQPPSPSLSGHSIPFPSGNEETNPAGPSRIPISTSPRARTKSSPFAPSSSSGRLPQPLHIGTSASGVDTYDQQPEQVREQDEYRSPGGTGKRTSPSKGIVREEEGLPPSRIPTRPRSKSQLGPRPAFASTNSHPPPPIPSGIPRPNTSRRGSSPTKPGLSSYQPTQSSQTEHLGQASGSSSRRQSYRAESPDLLKSRRMEGLVKNELPPFMMFQEDAMRIAEQGHDLESDSEGEYGSGYARGGGHRYDALSRSVGAGEAEANKRQRSITMRPDSRNSLDIDSPGRQSAGARKGGIGLGQPSTSSALRKAATQNRSASSRTNAQPTVGATGTGSGFTPRSASLNLIASTSMGTPSSASSSRLGVAAHFVPPENTWTPPKGANWDDVVIPAVAKTQGKNKMERAAGEEGDLAVEWDKDGVPIKWVKRGLLNTSQSSHTGLSVGDTNVTPSHAFSPTFGPSPDNPLHHKPSLTVPRSHSHSSSLRHIPSDQSIELTPVPIRTTRGHPTDIVLEPPVSSPPFSDMVPAPPGWQPQVKRKESGTGSGLGRKASLLRKQTSQMSVRNATGNQNRSNSGGQPAFAGSAGGGGVSGYGNAGIMTPERAAAAGAARGRVPSGGLYDNPRPAPSTPWATQQGSMSGRPGGDQFGQPPIAFQQDRPGQGGQKGNKDGEHGKGCGCVIM